MPVGCARGAPALEKHGVLAGGGAEGQLVKGQDLASGLQDALASLLRHVKGDNLQNKEMF